MKRKLAEQTEWFQQLHKKKRHYSVFSEEDSDASSEASFVRIQSPTATIPEIASERPSANDVANAIKLLRSQGIPVDTDCSKTEELVPEAAIADPPVASTSGTRSRKKKDKTPTLLESVRGMFFSNPIDEDVQSVSSLTRSVTSDHSTGTGKRGRGKGKAQKSKKDNEVEEMSERIKNDLVAFEMHLEKKMSIAFKTEREYNREKREEIENELRLLAEEREKDLILLTKLEKDLAELKENVKGVDDNNYTFIKQLKLFRSGVALDQYVCDASIDDDKGAFFQMQNNMGFNKTNEINGIEYADYLNGMYIRVWDLCSAGPDRNAEIVPTVSAGIYSLELEMSQATTEDIAMCVMYDQPSLLTLSKGGFLGRSYMQ